MYSIRDIVVLGIVGVSIPLCFVRPFYGIVLWTIFAFVNPHEFGWGIARQIQPALLIAVPTLAGAVFSSFKWNRLVCREVGLLVLLWVWFTLTTYNGSREPLFADNTVAAWYRWGLVSKILLMTLATVGIVSTWNRLRWLALSIAASFAFFVVKSIPFVILSGGSYRLYGPENSMIADNNDFGLALNMALPIMFFIAKTETNRRLKLFFGIVFLATIPAICFTYSRGALLGMAAVLVCMILQSKQKMLLIPVAMLAVVFAAFFTPQAWRDRMATTETTSTQSLDNSALSRLNAWTYSWRLATDYPLMGGGFDDFTPALFDRYAPNPKDVHGPHSVYFGVLAEHGFPGLFLYLTLVVACFSSLRKLRKMSRYYGDERANMYSSMLQFALVGFLVSGTFLGRAYFDLFFTIVACAVILKQVCVLEWVRQEEEFEAKGLHVPSGWPEPSVAR